ncbi:MAG: hypothetical protein KC431_29950 [Myxococcales bacterium]|nr:hypothetical protein [Myxococcales bacterium]MCA9701782.1 hypothetical protein [Myxococcales bacterium]
MPRLGRTGRAWIAAAAFAVGCFHGYDLEDKEPPPGYPGGTCVPGAGCRLPSVCYEEFGICYDQNDPCKGIYCGGNGTCTIDMANQNRPLCVCDPGYSNDAFAFFCL